MHAAVRGVQVHRSLQQLPAQCYSHVFHALSSPVLSVAMLFQIKSGHSLVSMPASSHYTFNCFRLFTQVCETQQTHARLSSFPCSLLLSFLSVLAQDFLPWGLCTSYSPRLLFSLLPLGSFFFFFFNFRHELPRLPSLEWSQLLLCPISDVLLCSINHRT